MAAEGGREGRRCEGFRWEWGRKEARARKGVELVMGVVEVVEMGKGWQGVGPEGWRNCGGWVWVEARARAEMERILSWEADLCRRGRKGCMRE